MSIDIKFRAWSPEIKEMFFSENADGGESREFYPFSFYIDRKRDWSIDDFILMQFTGLKDANGIEIYEGDICRILYTDWSSNTDSNIKLDEYLDSISYTGYIEFDSPEFCIMLKDRYGDRSASSLHYGQHGRIKVIGNIHQNPELL